MSDGSNTRWTIILCTLALIATVLLVNQASSKRLRHLHSSINTYVTKTQNHITELQDEFAQAHERLDEIYNKLP